tara:strand:- start:285 stop:635 length:351 start_codon:yes stop_codon:yes gene_type:complete
MLQIGLAITKNKRKFLSFKKLIQKTININQLINIINVSSQSILNKKIKGVALVVLNDEPISKHNQLFNIDNAFLSPHISGNFKGYQMALIQSFLDNLNRCLDYKPLKNRVCKKRLY